MVFTGFAGLLGFTGVTRILRLYGFCTEIVRLYVKRACSLLVMLLGEHVHLFTLIGHTEVMCSLFYSCFMICNICQSSSP